MDTSIFHPVQLSTSIFNPVPLSTSLCPSTPLAPVTTPSPSPRKHPALQQYTPGELGKLAKANAMDLARLGWSTFFASAQHPTSINPSIHNIPH
ncbi:MAG: hypothetical protein ACK53Y_22920, partial [bacterium]